MYAIQLPSKIPPAGSAGGPPLPAQFRQLGGIPMEFDLRATFFEVSRHPETIPAAVLRVQGQFEKLQAQQHRK